MFSLLHPNWRNGVSEAYEFRTEVALSENGKEERVARRSLPRRTISFRSTLSNKDAWRVISSMRDSFGSEVTLADYAHPVGKVVSTTGGTIIAQYWEDYWGDVVIPGAPGAFDSGYDSGYEGSTTYVDLTSVVTIGVAVQVGSLVYPAISGFPRDSFDLTYVTSDLAEVNTVVLTTNYTRNFPVDVDTVPSGEKVLHAQPNWSGGIDFSHLTPVDLVDYQDTVLKRYRKFALERHLRSYNFNLSRRDALQLTNLFYQVRGMQGEFYMPTWTEDFIPYTGVSLSSPVLVADSTIQGILEDWEDAAVTFILKNGEIFTRKIAAVDPYIEGSDAFNSGYDEGFDAQIPGTERVAITLTSGLGRNVSRREITMVSFTPLSRFASDTLSVNWVHHNLASIKINVQSVDKT